MYITHFYNAVYNIISVCGVRLYTLSELVALTIRTEKQFFSDEMSNGTVQPAENFLE